MNGNRLSPLCYESVIIVGQFEQSRQNWPPFPTVPA